MPPSDASRELLEKGIAALNSRQYAQSESFLREALALGISRAEVLFYLGLALSGRGDTAAAHAALEESYTLAPSPEIALVGGEMAVHLGAREAAFAWSERIAGAGPTHLAKLQSLADRHGAADMTRAAANYYAAAFRHAPDDLGLLRQLCYFLVRHDRKQAIALLESFIARHAQEPRLVSLAFLILLPQKEAQLRAEHGMGPVSPDVDLHFRFAQAELAKWHSSVADWLAAEPEEPAAIAQMALVHVSRGEPMEAEPHLEKLRTKIQSGHLYAAHFGASFFEAVDEAERDVGDGLPNLETLIAGKPMGPCLFVGCDALYFEKYGWAFVKSFAAHPRRTFLQLHIFDLAPEARADFLSRLAGVLGDTGYGVTAEWTGMKGKKEAANYYHAIRFIRASLFADAVRRPLCMVDVDIFCMHSTDGIFSHLNGFDAQLLFTPGRIEINNQIIGGFVIVNNTPAGLGFLRRMAGYIAVCRNRGELVWGVDQVALYAVYSEGRARGARTRFGSLPAQVFNWTYSDESIFWIGKCPEDDPVYPKFLAALARFSAPRDS